jgi:hypothetical protein
VAHSLRSLRPTFCIRSSFHHMFCIRLQSQSYVTTDGQSASLSWCVAPSGTQGQIFVTVRQLRVCLCGTPSLTRGRVCRFQLLLALTSAVILGSCLRFETPPTWRARSPYLYLPGTGWLSYTLRSGFPCRRLLRLAGLRWRYSDSPPHGHTSPVLSSLFWWPEQCSVKGTNHEARY